VPQEAPVYPGSQSQEYSSFNSIEQTNPFKHLFSGQLKSMVLFFF